MDMRVRDVPIDLHRELKAEAVLLGTTLELYVISLLAGRVKRQRLAPAGGKRA